MVYAVRKLIAIFTLMLTACANNNMVWYKPNATQEMLAQDRYVCLQQSQQPTASAYYGNYAGLLQSKQYTADAGMVTNNKLFEACMAARGWGLTDSNSLSKNRAKSRLAELQKQRSDLCISPQFQEIRKKSPCSVDELTPSMLADMSKVTEKEKQLLDVMVGAQNKISNEYFSILGQQIKSDKDKQFHEYLMTFSRPENNKNYAELYEGKKTWGEYNQRRVQISDSVKAEQRRIFSKSQ